MLSFPVIPKLALRFKRSTKANGRIKRSLVTNHDPPTLGNVPHVPPHIRKLPGASFPKREEASMETAAHKV